MKRLRLSSKQTKRGMASFYVVVFATMLFGVVTVSFMRIILSEAGQSSDDDLSRSAYDSAIAGVEDAKTAVNRYYSCINGSKASDEECNPGALFQDNCDDSIGLAKYLYGDQYNADNPDSVEVKIQEKNTDVTLDTSADQAYTCVIIKDTVPDYRGTLTSDTPMKAIPIGVYGSGTSSKLSEVKSIKFQWYSWLNEGSEVSTGLQLSDGTILRDAKDATIPPTIALTFIHMKNGASSEDFHNLNNDSKDDKLVYSTIVLLPSSEGDTGAKINYDDLRAAGNVNSADTQHKPIPVTCSRDSEFACSIDIDIFPTSFNDDDTVFLLASLPYNDIAVDFSTTLYNGETAVDFVGVQIQVDSTGRTNQLVRRVEARLDPTDLFFPYPEYELYLDGEGDENLSKAFWITANCWHTHPLDSQNGNDTSATPRYCPNNAKIDNNQNDQ